MEADLLQSFIQSCIEISPLGFIFGCIAMAFVKSNEAKNKDYVDAIEAKNKDYVDAIDAKNKDYIDAIDAKNKDYIDAIDAKHRAHIKTIEKHVNEIREDKGRYYQLVVEQGATLNEITAIVKRQAETIEQIVEIQQEQVDKLDKIESKIEWIDEHLSE